MNGSLYLQVMHDRCVNCNECSISVACPTDAFSRVPVETPYLMKQPALALVKQKARNSSDRAARELLRRVHDR
jgi:electron transport complex protein RnfB